MGSRGQLVLYHDQMRAAGKESIMPRRHWRGGARSHEVQPREVRLALSSVSAHAGSSARGPRFPARAGYESRRFKLEKFVATKHGVKWQRDFFDHRLRNDQELQEKTSYILMNPVRKGLCERVEDWLWVYRPSDRPPPLW